MNHNNHKQIQKDCRGFLRTAIFVSFLHRLTNIAAPTIAAWLIGDMTNHLLNLNTVAILSSMPSFLCAVVFQVVVVSIFNLVLNLLLTKQGFAYDSYLMEKFIHLPLSTVQTVDAGSVMERLEEDSAAFCWNQMTVCAYPCAIIVFASVLGYILFDNDCHIIFALTIVLLAALPIFRTAYIGKAQTILKKKTRNIMMLANKWSKSCSMQGILLKVIPYITTLSIDWIYYFILSSTKFNAISNECKNRDS